VTVVQEDRIGRPAYEVFTGPDAGIRGEQVVGNGAGIGAGCQPRRVAKQFEELKTKTLAGLGLRRADFQIGGGGKMLEAPGVDDPKHEDGKLLRLAGQIATEEASDGAGEGHARGDFDGLGFFDLRRNRRSQGELFLQRGLGTVHTSPA